MKSILDTFIKQVNALEITPDRQLLAAAGNFYC